jgi:hypothetical protein
VNKTEAAAAPPRVVKVGRRKRKKPGSNQGRLSGGGKI